MNIAMWSGPRNLSTAMMYAFGSRDDCEVRDEPFYAAYLAETGLGHPLRDEILASQAQNPAKVAAACVAVGPKVVYQKHMTQHMVPSIDRSWIDKMVNVFLIRDPARVIASYHKKHANPSLDDIGFWQQAEIFDQVAQATGKAPVVIDSYDILQAPAVMLEKLCGAIGLDYDPVMLGWPKGGNAADGVWAKHWYGAVWQSTGFAKPENAVPSIDEKGRAVLEAARPYYDMMAGFKI